MKLNQLPNIGKAISADLVSIGIKDSADLLGKNPLKVFIDLKEVMGKRHDPCVYYTLLSVEHFSKTGESLPWWKFTEQGKSDLSSI
jgi:DNA transformation protein